MPYTAPNQKVITINREPLGGNFLGINNENWKYAARVLGAHLTFDFMEKYITSHDDAEARMAEFDNLRGKSEEAQLLGATARSYGEIKAWFFKSYPEFEAFQRRCEQALAA